MHRTLPIILTWILAAYATATTWAVGIGQIRFHNEVKDTTAITNILIEVEKMGLDAPEKISSEIGKRFIGTPYVAGTLEGTPEMLTVNMEEVDCTTFVETVLAMTMTVENRRTSWHDFVYNLEQLRYRGGEVNGYASRLHYISDWIVDNAHRGILQDVTDRIGKADYQVKTIDYMSRHRNAYPALKDDTNYEGIKSAEIGYRSHRFPYIKAMNIKTAALREGDAVAITTSLPGLDVTHMGFITMVNGVPHLMHASSKAGKVIIDPLPLTDYLKRNRNSTGIRVIRLKD